MRTSMLGLTGLVLASAIITPVFAQEEEAASDFTVNGTAAVVSDYRFRGISQTDKDFAVQGSITVSHASGLYATVWGSSIDEYVAAGSDQEIDIIVGYAKTFDATKIDVGLLYYYYPGAEKIIPDYKSDFFEPYAAVSQTFGPVTAKLLVAYAPKQSALDFGFGKEDNLYANLGLSGSVPDTGVGLSASIGHTFTKSFLSAGKKYTDWSVGASYTTGPLTFGIAYVDTDLPKFQAVSLTGKDVAKAGVVGTLTAAF